MSRTRVALVVGLAFLGVAILGFLTTGTTMEASMEHAPRLLGLFPVNLLHNLIHLVFGLWGLVASRGAGAARSFLRIAGVIYLALAALAFVSPTTFGLVPIGGHDIWLHLVLGAIMAYFGFARGGVPAATAPRAT
jgi:hypothetical protein